MHLKASVILPVYNGEKHVKQTIESILPQLNDDLELIIVDDGSTDQTLSIISGFERSNIRIYSQENRGLGATLNRLVSLSLADIIIRMDGDDLAAPLRFERQIDFLENNLDHNVVGGQIRFLVGNTTVKASPMPLSHRHIIDELRHCRFPVCHPAIAFRKKDFLQVGGYKVHGCGEDLDFFLRMAEVGRFANLSSHVLDYRIQLNSLSASNQHELYLNYSHAVHNHFLRMKAMPEITFEQFKKEIMDRSTFLFKVSVVMRSASEQAYRRSIIHRASGLRTLSVINLGLAACLRPKVVARRSKSIFFAQLQKAFDSRA